MAAAELGYLLSFRGLEIKTFSLILEFEMSSSSNKALCLYCYTVTLEVAVTYFSYLRSKLKSDWTYQGVFEVVEQILLKNILSDIN